MNKTLLTLNLDYNTTLGSDGLAALSRGLRVNSTLQNLSLRFCGIDEHGGQYVSNILAFSKTCIASINMEGNQLGGFGLLKLCPGLKSNATIRSICLADNKFKPTDVIALECFGETISKHETLTEVSIVRNIIGNDGGLALSRHLEQNKKITSFKVDTTLSSKIYEVLSRIPVSEKKKGKKKASKKK